MSLSKLCRRRVFEAKHATLLLGLAILMVSVVAAAAKVDRACMREARETFGTAQAKRICDTKNSVKPNEYGWLCEGAKISKVKGAGTRRKRDAVCE
jgi:hypothetical protein